MTLAVRLSAKGTGAATTVVTSLGDTLPARSRFVVMLHSGSFLSITDNKGNVYAEMTRQSWPVDANLLRVFEAEGVGGAGHTITTTYSSSSNRYVLAAEIAESPAPDVRVSNSDAATPFTIATPALVTPVELALLFATGDTSSNPTTHAESTGFTIHVEETNGATYFAGFLASKNVTVTTALTPSWTQSGGTDGVSAVWTFRDASPPVNGPDSNRHPALADPQIGTRGLLSAASWV